MLKELSSFPPSVSTIVRRCETHSNNDEQRGTGHRTAKRVTQKSREGRHTGLRQNRKNCTPGPENSATKARQARARQLSAAASAAMAAVSAKQMVQKQAKLSLQQPTRSLLCNPACYVAAWLQAPDSTSQLEKPW